MTLYEFFHVAWSNCVMRPTSYKYPTFWPITVACRLIKLNVPKPEPKLMYCLLMRIAANANRNRLVGRCKKC